MRKSILLRVLLIAALLLASLPWNPAAIAAPPADSADPTVWFVMPGAAGDCSSWANACELQTALTGAISPAEIWVAAGVYYPGVDRTDTFTLKSGVELYGGFAGTENDRDARDWETNLTILSGDIDGDGELEENAYHVVSADEVDAAAVLDGFIIEAGNANLSPAPGEWGGGIYLSDSYLTIRSVILRANYALYGGGMFVEGGAPVLVDVEFLDNQVLKNGGGLHTYANSTPALTNVSFSRNTAVDAGGGMYNGNSTPTLSGVTFSSNSALKAGGGMYNMESSPTLAGVIFSGNSAANEGTSEGYGGGMNNYRSHPLLTGVTFSNNSAQVTGGGMVNEYSHPALTNVAFTANEAGYSGGGMYNQDSNPTLTNTTFSANTADKGGGMSNEGSAPGLTHVTFSANTAVYFGGGVYNVTSSPTLTNTTFSANTANSGGGMYNETSRPTLTNVTFSGNAAVSNGGGMYNWVSNPLVTNATFAFNAAASGGGMFNIGTVLNVVTATNTILWDNTPDQIGGGVANFISVTYSVIQNGYTGAGNIPADPLLGSLADNGGSTLTHALLAGSLAIDAGSPLLCPPTDQRGMSRPVDGNRDGQARCDIGAFEYWPPAGPLSPTTTTITGDDPDPSQVGESFTVTFAVTSTVGTPTGVVNVTVSGSLVSCSAVLVGGLGSCELILSAPGAYTLTAHYGGSDYFDASSASAAHTVTIMKRLYLPMLKKP